MRSWFFLVFGMACSAGYHTDNGKEALDTHDLAGAEASYRTALSRDPAHAPALAGLGWTYLLAGEVEAARGAFERCSEVEPESTECLRGRASVASSTGNTARALTLLEQAVGLDPYDAGVLSSLALLELAQGKLPAADARYSQLIARFPDKAEYRLGLAEVRIRQDRETEAVEEVEAGLACRDLPVRTRAMLLQTQARALIAATADRVDPDRCAQTAPQVRAWLDAADSAVSGASGTGISLPDLPVVGRLLRRRRASVEAECPLGG
jgi:Flp pilus assembly protein TadD